MRFFNKDFFKFTLGFLSIISLSLLIIAAATTYAAEVSKLNFTTEERQVKPNELSEVMTIQAQDSSGNSFQTPETIDLVFVSTSPTGEFLNSAGNSATTYMSRNTANRSFYYRDSTMGTHTITIFAAGRDSGKEWSVSQEIVISNSASSNTNNTSSGSSSNLSSGAISATAGPSVVTTGSNTSTLEVVAGSDRFTAPGSPLTFQATVKKGGGSNSSLEFNWSFGDGEVGSGELVSHTYRYTGDYALVLNARSGNSFATSRLKVRVAEPDLSMEKGDDYVEVTNNGSQEINLFNWKVENEGKGFIFQPDTIILPGSTVRFEESLFKMKWALSRGTALMDSLDRTVLSVVPELEPVNHEPSQNFALELNSLLDQAISIKYKLYALSASHNDADIIDENMNSQQAGVTEVDLEQTPSALGATEANSVVYEAESEDGTLVQLTNFIKKLFSE